MMARQPAQSRRARSQKVARESPETTDEQRFNLITVSDSKNERVRPSWVREMVLSLSGQRLAGVRLADRAVDDVNSDERQGVNIEHGLQTATSRRRWPGYKQVETKLSWFRQSMTHRPNDSGRDGALRPHESNFLRCWRSTEKVPNYTLAGSDNDKAILQSFT